MVRSHGWSGNAPASDDEAVVRILDAADAIVAKRGSAMRISDVARSLGVTRQTVYRYFPGSDALLLAIALRSGDGFLDRLTSRVAGMSDPVEAMVEGVAFAIEHLADDERIAILLARHQRDGGAATLTSDTAMAFGRSLIQRFDVDWKAHGFDARGRDELCEFGLRLLYSFLVDPGPLARDPDALRAFLARWVGPAMVYPRVASAMGALDGVTQLRSPGDSALR